MTDYEVLKRAFNLGFRPSINHHHQLVAIRSPKTCCIQSRKIKKEDEAVQEATRWLSSHKPTDAHSYQAFRSLYRGVLRRQKEVYCLTHGFFGWFKSLFLGKAKTKKIRQLEASLITMRKAMRAGNQFGRSITSQIEASDSAVASDTLFKQVSAEMPEAVVSSKAQVTAANFGMTSQHSTPEKPFLIQRNQSGYHFIFPPNNHQSAPEIITRDSLLDLPLLVREHHSRKLFQACDSINCSLAAIQLNPRATIDKLHLELHRPTSDRADYQLIAHDRNPLTGRIETRELILDANQTEESVKNWATELIRANQARLAEIDDCLSNNPDGIQADLQSCQYSVFIDLGEGFERLQSRGLQKSHFERLKANIASGRNQIAITKINKEFFEINKNETGEILRTVGAYEFSVMKGLKYINNRLSTYFAIHLDRVDGELVYEKLCEVENQILEEVLNQTIQTHYYQKITDIQSKYYNPYNIHPDFITCQWKANFNYKGYQETITHRERILTEKNFQELQTLITQYKEQIDTVERNNSYFDELSKAPDGSARLKLEDFRSPEQYKDWEFAITPKDSVFKLVLKRPIIVGSEAIKLNIHSEETQTVNLHEEYPNRVSLKYLIYDISANAVAREKRAKEAERIYSIINRLNQPFSVSDIQKISPLSHSEIELILSNLQFHHFINRKEDQWIKTKDLFIEDSLGIVSKILKEAPKFKNIISHIQEHAEKKEYSPLFLSHETIYSMLKELEGLGFITFRSQDLDTLALSDNLLEEGTLIMAAIDEISGSFKLSDIKNRCPSVSGDLIERLLAEAEQECFIERDQKSGEYRKLSKLIS